MNIANVVWQKSEKIQRAQIQGIKWGKNYLWQKKRDGVYYIIGKCHRVQVERASELLLSYRERVGRFCHLYTCAKCEFLVIRLVKRMGWRYVIKYISGHFNVPPLDPTTIATPLLPDTTTPHYIATLTPPQGVAIPLPIYTPHTYTHTYKPSIYVYVTFCFRCICINRTLLLSHSNLMYFAYIGTTAILTTADCCYYSIGSDHFGNLRRFFGQKNIVVRLENNRVFLISLELTKFPRWKSPRTDPNYKALFVKDIYYIRVLRRL